MCCIQNSFSIKRLFVLTLLFSLSHSRCHVFACEISLPSRHLMMKKGGSKYVVIRLEFLWWKTFFLFFESLKKNSKVRWEEKKMSNDVGEGMHLPKPISGFSWSYLIIQSFFLAQKHGFFFWFCDFSHTYR